MNNDGELATTNERLRMGRFLRRMLRPVRPEHVPDIIHMLHLLEHGGKRIEVHDGPWLMPMPHDYALRGHGPVGIAIEPPPDLEEVQAPARQPNNLTTAEILLLCYEARILKRPERDTAISRLYALKIDQCSPDAVRAIELLSADIVNGELE